MTSTMRFDKWENSLGQAYGTVLQVSTQTVSLNESTSVNGLVTSSYSIGITPKFANSKILVMMNFVLQSGNGGALGARAGIGRSIAGGSVSDIFLGTNPAAHNIAQYSTNWNNNHHRTTLITTDSPNTTSEVRYYVRYGAYNTATVNLGNDGHSACSFTLMEIAQ